MARVVSFLSILAVLAVMFVLFSCSLSPSPSATNEGSGGSVADKTPPSVTITFPTDGQVLYDNNITVSGTASDVGSGVKEVWLSVNGGGYGKVNGTTSWSTNVTVNYGSNTIRVYAVDNSGNVSTTNTVSFVVGDTNKPSVSITTPMNGQVLYDNNITVSGTASDVGSGVKEVWLSVNGGGFGLVNGTTNWSTNVTVNYGSNTIRVYAVDNSNNVSTTNTVSVFRDYVVFVSTGGSDANTGGISDPFRSINVAMSHISTNITDLSVTVEVRVGSGVYTPGSGLSSSGSGFVINRPNVIISGGWDSSFSSVVDKSELDGNNSLYHIVMITNVTNVRLENLVIRGGNANDVTFPNNSGGGIYVSNASYLAIESNVVISNNYADSFGGGVYLWSSPNNTISGSVYGNSANYGGGVYLDNSTNITISGSVYSNSATWGGGGIFLWVSTNNTISGSVYGNSATWGGGGGLYLDNSPNNTISGDVYGNSSADNGGGVFLYDSTSNTISGSVYGNSANYGGGVYLDYSDYFTNTGWITNNTAGFAGGGVYTNGSHPNSYFGNISNNSPDDIAP